MLRERKKIMAKELEKNYDPADIEQRTYDKWIAKKYFHAGYFDPFQENAGI